MAFTVMSNKQVHGLAVTNAEGQLTDVISVQDLRGLTLEAGTLIIFL